MVRVSAAYSALAVHEGSEAGREIGLVEACGALARNTCIRK